MFNEYNLDIEQFIDNEADQYIPLEELLDKTGITFDDALAEAEAFKKRFFDTLSLHHIHGNVSRIYFSTAYLFQKVQNDDSSFLYSAVINENGILFGNISDDEQKIRLWLEFKENFNYFVRLIGSHKIMHERLNKLISHKPDKSNSDFDANELDYLYSLPRPGSVKSEDVYRENLGELIRKTNSDKLYSSIKPYIYAAAISRKKKKITNCMGYSINIKSLLTYKNYVINSGNGKNTEAHEYYLDLYKSLKKHFTGCDIEMSDYCFAYLSNISDFLIENNYSSRKIPVRLSSIVSDIIKYKDISVTLEDYNINNDIADDLNLDEVYGKILYGSESLFPIDFIKAFLNDEDISCYAEQLYEKTCSKYKCTETQRKDAIDYARLSILFRINDFIKYTLIDAAKNL